MSRQRRTTLLVVLASVACLLIVLRLGLNRVVWSRIASSLRDTYGLEIAVDSLSLSLFDGRATARGLQISDSGELVFAAEAVELSASLRDLIGNSFDFESLLVTRPFLHIVVEEGGGTNLARIRGRSVPSSAAPSLVIFQEASIVEGRCRLDDVWSDPKHPAQLSFEGIELRLRELQLSGKPRSSELGDIRLDARLAQTGVPAQISLVGWAPPFGERLTIALHAAITGLDLAQLQPYLTKSTRSALGGDLLHLRGSMRTQDGEIEDGALVAQVVGTDTEYPLRFGGTSSQIVFDENSKLAALFHLPLARLGHLGDVALTSTWGAASDLGSGLVDAGSSLGDGVAKALDGMVRLDPLGALEAAGNGLLGGAQALGEGLATGADRVFGGGADREARGREDAKQAQKFAQHHARLRREMLVAALESAKGSSGARARRIEEELRAENPPSVELAQVPAR